MDPQALVQCPYDKNHRVRVSRLPYHLVKCQQNNPDVARTLVTCPFNARHRVPRQQLHSHMAFCPDQLQPSLSPELGTSLSQRGQEPKGPVAQPAPPWEEDWEAEVENLEERPPFIFNGSMNNRFLRDGSVPSAPTNPRRGPGATRSPVAQKRA
ncbi:gametocyte-specific factor 1 isoform X2 [Phaenicophaeus curvirostris]|uniref:gametocyte-specific factor 1 isoform X2 n=1 Tax=Phaenicophaeus curvirostris TaxID=33595 RepID=UPI0037F0A5CF